MRISTPTAAWTATRRHRAALAAALLSALLILPEPASAQTPPEQLVNDRLAFGGIPTDTATVDGVPVGPLSAASSVMTSSGMLDSPYYRSTVDGNWYPMTYNGYSPSNSTPAATIPLSFGLGVGRWAGGDTFHQNAVIAVAQISNSRSIDADPDTASLISGTDVSTVDADGAGENANTVFTVARTAGDPGRGPGTLQAVGHLQMGAQRVEITHTYTLEDGRNYLQAVSSFKNLSSTTLENVNFWIGTSDDWLSLDDDDYSGDSPSQRKGLIQGNAFRAVCEGPTNAVITFNDKEYTLLYSNSGGSQGLLTDNINSFQSSLNDSDFTNTEEDPYESIIDLDPSTTEDEILDSDAAVGLFLPVGDIAAGETGSVTWFIEGGSLGFTVQDCNFVASTGPSLQCTPDPVAPGATVTASITQADSEIDFLWRASHDGSAYAEAGVPTTAQGTGSFTFTVPASAAAGSTVTAELVEWNTACTVTVAGNALPTRLPAGEGPAGDGARDLMLLAGVLASVALVARRRLAGVR